MAATKLPAQATGANIRSAIANHADNIDTLTETAVSQAASLNTKLPTATYNENKTATDAAIADKVSKDGSKVLSDNNYTTSEKNKLGLLSTNQNSSLGAWNASTNTPTLTSNPSPAVQGQEYTVSVAGTQSITGSSIAFGAGDKIKSNGTAWVRIPYVGVNTTEFAAVKNALPYDISVYPNPTRQVGYYRSDNGLLVAGVTPYSAYLLDVANYGEKIYVSASIQDAGTALAVYFGDGDVFLGKEFQGTASNVVYTDQLLSPPAGTKKIGLTERSNTPSLVIKSGNISNGILTKKIADASYAQLSPIQKQVKLQLTSASNIVLYSSSISSSDYPWYVESLNQCYRVCKHQLSSPRWQPYQQAFAIQMQSI